MTARPDWALTGNAGDADQVKEAGESELRGRQREIAELQDLLSLASFQRFYWRALDRASVFTSVVASTPEMTYHNAGQQDFGHWLLAELDAAKPEALIEMMKRAKAEKPTKPKKQRESE